MLALYKFETKMRYAIKVLFLFVCPSLVAIEPTSVMRTESIFLIQLLEQYHFSKKSLKTLPWEDVLVSFVNSLDSQKMIFTKKQVDQFVNEYRYASELLWRGGSLIPGFRLFESYRKKFNDRITWVTNRLDRPFDYQIQQIFDMDRKIAPWCSNLIGLDLLWEQRLQHEMINEMISLQLSSEDDPIKKTDEDISPITEEKVLLFEKKARENLKTRYENLNKIFQSLDAVDIQEFYCNNLAQFYDPHTTFLSADTMDDFSISLKNSLVGIGAYLSEENGTCVIKEILPGGPAEHCKMLQAGDKILEVAEGNSEFVNIQGMKLRNSVKLIRGPKGTKVRLLVQPVTGDPSQRKIVELIREEIKLENNLAFAKIFSLPDSSWQYHRIGIIDLPAFYGAEDPHDIQSHTLSNDVRELLFKLKAQSVEGIILDMRRNGGGLLSEAIRLVGLFLNKCPVVQAKDGQQIARMYSGDDTCVWEGPLLILTSRFSASASEIVAGALQEAHRAFVFGDKTTHGKGSVQAVIELDKLAMLSHLYGRMGAVKLTIQKWYLPSGSSIQLRGVQADLSQPSLYDGLPIGEADLPHALPWDAIEPMPPFAQNSSSCCFFNPRVHQYLLLKQHYRQQTDKIFQWHLQQVKQFTKNYQQTSFSLNLKERIQNINKERKLQLQSNQEEKTWVPRVYRRLFLQGARSQKVKKENTKIDFFENEALNIMADWLQCLGIHEHVFPLWTYGFKYKNKPRISF